MPGLLSRPDDPGLAEAPGQVNRAQELDAVDAAHVYAVVKASYDRLVQLGNVRSDPKALAAALADAAGQEVAARLHENVLLGQKYETLVQAHAVLRRQPNKLKLQLNQAELDKVAKQLREGTWQLYQYLQDRPDPMDIVALAALEQVTLRSRFQACLTELQASQGRLAPPTLMALVRMTSAPLLPVPSLTEAQAFARQATAAASPPAVPRLNLASTAEGAAAPSSGPMSEEYRAEGAGGRDRQGPGHAPAQPAGGQGVEVQPGTSSGGAGPGMEQGQVDTMVEREREANAAIKQLRMEWRDEHTRHEQQMAEASKALAGLAVEYRRRQARLASDADYCERQARAAEEAAAREEALRLAQLHTRASALKKQIEQERRVHEAATAFLKKQTNELTEQGLQWASKLENDLADKDRELDNIRHNHQQAQALLRDAEDRQGRELALKQHRDTSAKLQADLEQSSQAKHARQAAAATLIQAAWRGHALRSRLKNAKSGKPKKKK
ncbi:hypothetical protein WJX84_001464 [Apatococcus fuscideae]|uniref:Dynein regulatory complex protein 9 n=1 Tax=Apatococcus fuscideae TaxID=2026836 RepID=A0AAW1TDF6_9CHLO